MRIATLTAIVLMTLTQTVFARLGETEQQCEARYGKPQVRKEVGGYVYASYDKSGYVVSIVFVVNPVERAKNPKAPPRVGMISYAKLNKKHPVYQRELLDRRVKFIDICRDPVARERLSPKAINAFLNANSRGGWEWQSPHKNFDDWTKLLDRKRYKELLWKSKSNPNITATYDNMFRHNMLTIRDEPLKTLTWKKVDDLEKNKPAKTSGGGALDGF